LNITLALSRVEFYKYKNVYNYSEKTFSSSNYILVYIYIE